jgi:hypothetical protein
MHGTHNVKDLPLIFQFAVLSKMTSGLQTGFIFILTFRCGKTVVDVTFNSQKTSH